MPPPASDRSCCVCEAPLAYEGTGRRPVYCSKPCRQAVYRAGQRARKKIDKAASCREELTAAVHQLREHLDHLAGLLDEQPPINTDAVPQDSALPTGWETTAIELVHQLMVLSPQTEQLAQEHRVLAVGYRKDAGTARKGQER